MAQETKKVNITIEAGANFQMYFTVRDDAERLIDLTGCTVEAQLREYAEASDYLEFTVTHNGSGGRVSISMPFEDTAAIPYDSGVYDVYITDTDNIREKYLEGDVEITPAVTKPVAGEIIYLLSFASEDDFPSYGMVRRLYFSHATNHMYRWNGTAYVDIVTDGEAATVEVGDVETLPAGSDATVENVGSLLNAVFNFGIPEGNGIESIEKTGTDVLTDTYTITFTDPNVEAFDFDVVNGRGITAITKTSSGLTDTYTVSYNDGTEYVFNLHNGNGIESIDKSTSGLTDTYTLTFHDGSTLDMVITNGKGITSVVKTTDVLDDTYTVTWNDGTVTTYTISNGKGIVSIEKTSTEDLEDEYTVTFNDGDTFTYTVTNGMDCTHSWNGTVLTITSASGTSSADLQGTTDYEQLTNVPETFPPEAHNHDDRYYTETEMDTALATKATTTALSALENSTIAALALKANASDVYTKTDIDSALADKADADDVYTKDDVDDALAEKANSDDVYTKSATDTLLLDKAPVILNSASGSIASFTDGSALPVTALSVAIEPVQDLHGYDNPWPAGGGKNLLDFAHPTTSSKITSVTDNGNGAFTIVASGGSAYMNYTIPVTAGETYCVKCESVSSTSGTLSRLSVIYVYDGDITGSELISGQTATTTRTFTPSQSTVVLSWRSSLSTETSGTGIITKPQLEKGSIASSWTPYSNICPISGHTSAVVTRTGKNILPSTIYNYAVSHNKIVQDANYRSMYCKVISGKTYTVSRNTISGNRFRLIGTTVEPANGVSATTFVSADTTGTLSETITIPDGYNYLLIYLSNQGDTITSNIQVELGSTATSYEPYQPIQTVTIDLGEERYGGTLDVLSGTLMVDRAMVDLGALTWRKHNSGYYFAYDLSSVILAPSSNSRVADILCESYKPDTAVNASSTNGSVGVNNTGTVILCNSSIETLEDLVTALTNVKLIYKLATPFTVQLTPSQMMQTLLGENHIWANTGDVEVTYRADTKLFIQEQIAESQLATRSLIAGIETEMVASKNYSTGDLLIVGDTLYKTLSSIASGATLTVGTNVAVTTVAEQLIALANA